MGRGHRIVLAVGSLVSLAALAWLAGGTSQPEGRRLSEEEREQVLPLLARTNRPDLAPFSEIANRLLSAGGSDDPIHIVDSTPPIAVVGPEAVELSGDFPEALSKMTEALKRVRGVGATIDPALFGTPEVTAVLASTYREMRDRALVQKGRPYLVSRFGVLMRAGGEYRLELTGSPELEVVHAMDDARMSWDEAMGVWRRHRGLLLRGDPHRLFENLQERDRRKGYDERQRRAHLGLVLEAVLPNLIDAVVVDPAGILELGLHDRLDGEVIACVAIRQFDVLNVRASRADHEFARRVAPLYVFVVEAGGSAALMRVTADGDHQIGPDSPRYPLFGPEQGGHADP